MSRPLDLASRRFGRLVAVERAARRPGAWWRCVCDCGASPVIIASSLTSGNSKSCGCGQREAAGATARTHGESGTPAHQSWKNMWQRCTNASLPEFKHYGGRGITVCARWRNFAEFLSDMGPRPAGGTLDRIDNDRGYEPGNCRWATRQTQADNTRVTHMLTVNGETAPLGEWSRRTGLTKEAIRSRLRAGWTEERAVLTPKLRNPNPQDATMLAAMEA